MNMIYVFNFKYVFTLNMIYVFKVFSSYEYQLVNLFNITEDAIS